MESKELVVIRKGKPLTTSKDVAKAFGRRRDTISRAIREAIKKISDSSLNETLFYKAFETNPQNHQSYPFYYMTEDGFDLIAAHYIASPQDAMARINFKSAFKNAKSKLNEEKRKMKVYTDTNKVSKDTGYTVKRLDSVIRTQLWYEPELKVVYKFTGNMVWQMTQSGFIILLSHLNRSDINQYKIDSYIAKANHVNSGVLYRNLRAIRYALNTNTREFAEKVGMSLSNYHSAESGLVKEYVQKFTDKQKETISKYVLSKLFEEDKEVLKSRKHQLSVKKASEKAEKQAMKDQTEKKYTKQDVIDMVNKILAEKGVTND